MAFTFLKIDQNTDNLNLNCQCEELKGLLRGNDLLLKDQQFKYTKMVENYENQITRLTEENKQIKDKYEKIFEAQRKLEKLNSDLEERLLKIVEKYENEQKNLLEELTIAHSSLVETKLQIDELEKEKESFRQDCNLAVNLLQCKPSEFVSHSYRSLPIDLKNRLKSHLTQDEILKLEHESENEIAESAPKSLPKLPVFQPTAAAAMMYNMQNNTLQREKLKQKSNDLFSSNNQNSVIQIENEEIGYGRISANLISKVLRKDSDQKSKKSFKLFPYICLRCKKEAVHCDSPAQTNLTDLENLDLRVLLCTPRNILADGLLRSKTIGSTLSEFNDFKTNNLSVNRNKSSINHHQKCASTDLGSFKNAFYI